MSPRPVTAQYLVMWTFSSAAGIHCIVRGVSVTGRFLTSLNGETFHVDNPV
jgi:hypothetical protein